MDRKQLRIFGVLLLVVLSMSEVFLIHNTLYTEGEVTEGLYRMLVGFNIPILVLVLWKPKAGLWLALGLGALLLPWQTYKNGKWAVMHEEVVDIVRHLEKTKASDGSYANSLAGYEYKNGWTKNQITYIKAATGFRLSYFMDDPGISYWYESTTGFGYYPD